MSDQEPLTGRDCWIVFQQLFPHGLQDPALVTTLAPEGWERSPFLHVYHPTTEQQEEESRMLNERIDQSRRTLGLDQIASEDRQDHELEPGQERPIDPIAECAMIVGECLWDIFSDNHRVTTVDGQRVNLGSFRAASCFIGRFHDRPNDMDEEGRMDWTDPRFYCGTVWHRGRADLTPVYQLIFRRMKRLGLDWQFVAPQLHLISFGEEIEPGLQASVHESNYQSLKDALAGEPPLIVAAYRDVYGYRPEGWPPSIRDWEE